MCQVFNRIYRAIVRAFNRKFIMCSIDYKSHSKPACCFNIQPFQLTDIIRWRYTFIHCIYTTIYMYIRIYSFAPHKSQTRGYKGKEKQQRKQNYVLCARGCDGIRQPGEVERWIRGRQKGGVEMKWITHKLAVIRAAMAREHRTNQKKLNKKI